MSQNITVIIPAFNEATNIGNTIKSLQTLDIINKIVVIDDGSMDNTYAISKGLGIEVYRLKENRGKGYALKYGLGKVIKDSKIIIFLDGDLGDTSKEAIKLITPLLSDHVDVTVGKFPPAKKKGGIGLVKGLSKLGIYTITGEFFSSALSGQRAFKVEVLKSIQNIPQDYGIEIGMLIDILNKGFIVKEVEVDMTHNETGRNLAGFIHRGRQFFQILRVLIRKYREVKFLCF